MSTKKAKTETKEKVLKGVAIEQPCVDCKKTFTLGRVSKTDFKKFWTDREGFKFVCAACRKQAHLEKARLTKEMKK